MKHLDIPMIIILFSGLLPGETQKIELGQTIEQTV